MLAEGKPPVQTVAAGGSVDVALSEPGRNADVVVLDLNLGTAEPGAPDCRRWLRPGIG